MSSAGINSLQKPFPNADTLHYGFQFLELQDAGRCCQVSKLWKKEMEYCSVWLTLFGKEKIPCIKGRESEAKKDLEFMLCHTFSARKFACFGKFIGEVPMITAETLDFFKIAVDQYKKGRKMLEQWAFIVEPTHFFRSFEEKLYQDLCANGDFDKKIEIDKLKIEGLFVSNTPKHIKILAERPVKKKYEGTIFRLISPGFFNQINKVAESVNVSIMRIKVPKQTLKLTSRDQQTLLGEYGHVLPPFRVRFLFNLAMILNDRTCADKRKYDWLRSSNVFSRCSEIFKGPDDYLYPVAVGGFISKKGLRFGCTRKEGNAWVGAAPYLSLSNLAPEDRKCPQ